MKVVSAVLQKAISHDEIAEELMVTRGESKQRSKYNKFPSEPSLLDQLTTCGTQQAASGKRDDDDEVIYNADSFDNTSAGYASVNKKLPPLLPPRPQSLHHPHTAAASVKPSVSMRHGARARKPTLSDGHEHDRRASRAYVERRISSLRRASLSGGGVAMREEEEEEEEEGCVKYAGPHKVKRARILTSSTSSAHHQTCEDDETSHKNDHRSSATPNGLTKARLSPQEGVENKKEAHINSNNNNNNSNSNNKTVNLPDVAKGYFPSLERLRGESGGGGEQKEDVSSVKSRNTWDEQLSDRTEDNYLPQSARKFRGLIRGANCKADKKSTPLSIRSQSSSPLPDQLARRRRHRNTPSPSLVDMTLESNLKLKLQQREMIERSVDSLSSSPSSSSTNSADRHHHHHHHRPHSVYDNHKGATATSSTTSSLKKPQLPDMDAIVDTVKSVRLSTQGSNTTGSTCSTRSSSDEVAAAAVEATPNSANTNHSINIDDEWAQIATIMSSVALDVSDGMKNDAAYSKEFEQTFWKLMTGKHKGSIQGWLHDIGLEQYEAVLVGNGFDSVEFLADVLEEKDLIDMEILNYEDRRSLLRSCAHLQPLPSPPPQPTLAQWLTSLHLQSYLDKFNAAGCRTVDHVMALDSDVLHSILTKRGHFKRAIVSMISITRQQQQQQQQQQHTKIDLPSPHKSKSGRESSSRTAQLARRRYSERQVTPKLSPCHRQTSLGAADCKSHDKINKISPTSSTYEIQQNLQQMSGDSSGGAGSDLPDVKRAVYLSCEKSSGSRLNLRPPNETTQQVSVSAWRHDPHTLITSQCTYQAQYLGSMLIHELKGQESTVEACAKMKKSTTQMKKMPLITLAISYHGVKFIDFESKHEIAEHDISNISFASQDREELSTFAYITHDSRTSKHYCHVFRVSTLDTAYEIILTIGQAFEIAYQLILKEQAMQDA